MSELSPELARVLTELGRAHEPTAADEARVLVAVQLATAATLTAAGGALASSASDATALGAAGGAKVAAFQGGVAAKLVAALLSVSGVATGVALWHRHDGAAPDRPALDHGASSLGVGAPALPPDTAPAPVEALDPFVPREAAPSGVPSAVPVGAPADAPASVRRRSAAPVVPSAGAELALVRAAQAALRDGAPTRALDLLDAYRQRFPHGVLDEEQRGIRVLALCAAGQRATGREARAAFLAESASSPLATRVASACAEGEPER